jgi:hypothetical protein
MKFPMIHYGDQTSRELRDSIFPPVPLEVRMSASPAAGTKEEMAEEINKEEL